MKNFESLINDLKKAAEISKQMKQLSVKINDPLIEVAKYAVSSRIVTSSADILELSTYLSFEIVQIVAKQLDIANDERATASSYNNDCYNYRCGVGVSDRC